MLFYIGFEWNEQFVGKKEITHDYKSMTINAFITIRQPTYGDLYDVTDVNELG